MATKTLAAQAQKAIVAIKRLHYKVGGLPMGIALQLFDKQILPILCYGSEVWGYQRYERIETVQTKFCKFFLGVGS